MVTMVTIVTNLVMVVYWIHVKEKMVSVQTHLDVNLEDNLDR